MGQFDQTARYLIKRDPPAFFRWVIPGMLPGWRFRGFLDTSTVVFPGEPDRICDTVGEFVEIGHSRRRLVDAEVQAEPHPDMLERLGEYAYRLRRELRFGRRRKFDVLSVLLNLTGTVRPAELDMTAPELDGAGARLLVVQRTLRDEDAAATLARIERGELDRPVLAWVALMRGAERRGIIEEWKRLAAAEPDSRWRADHGALIFADLAGRKPAWQAVLGDWEMKESTVIKEWLQKGVQKGEIQARRADLIEALETRCGAGLPADLLATITEMSDLDQLSRWFRIALTTISFDAFRTAAGL